VLQQVLGVITGAFSYIVKNKKPNGGFNLHTDDMKGRQVLVLGASGKVGFSTFKRTGFSWCRSCATRQFKMGNA